MIELSIEVKQDLYLCFIDFSKAFDKVKHEGLFQILAELNIDGKDLRILQNFHRERKRGNNNRWRVQSI